MGIGAGQTLASSSDVNGDVSAFVTDISTQNTDTVNASANGDETTTGTFSITTSQAEYFNVERITRIGVTGTLKGIRVRPGPGRADANITNMRVRVWRGTTPTDISNATLVNSSEDIKSSYAALADNVHNNIIFSGGLAVQEADHMSILFEVSGNVSDIIRTVDGINSPATKIKTDSVAVTGHDWESETDNDDYVPFIALMEATNVVAIGNSRTKGVPGHHSFNTSSGPIDIDRQIVNKLADLFPAESWNYRNMGVSGDRIDEVLVRFQRDVRDLKPKACIFMDGLLDANASRTLVDYLADMTSMLDDCVTDGINPILVKSLGSTTLSDEQSELLRTYNNALIQYKESHNAVVVDPIPLLGKRRQSTGELDEILDEYTTDGTHLTDDANTVIAQLVADGINQQQITVTDGNDWFATGLSPITPSSNGNKPAKITIQMSVTTGVSIEVTLDGGTNYAIINDGEALTANSLYRFAVTLRMTDIFNIRTVSGSAATDIKILRINEYPNES